MTRGRHAENHRRQDTAAMLLLTHGRKDCDRVQRDANREFFRDRTLHQGIQLPAAAPIYAGLRALCVENRGRDQKRGKPEHTGCLRRIPPGAFVVGQAKLSRMVDPSSEQGAGISLRHPDTSWFRSRRFCAPDCRVFWFFSRRGSSRGLLLPRLLSRAILQPPRVLLSNVEISRLFLYAGTQTE